MPIYEYKALTDEGKRAEGVLDADTPQDARAKLRAMRLHPTAVRAAAVSAPEGRAGAPSARLEQALRRRKLANLPLLTRQLATLLKAGIPLADALNAMIEQAEEPLAEKVFRDVRERIRGGASFAEALAAHPDLFGDLYVNMVRAGEASGNLDAILFDLARFTQRQHSLRNKVAAAMAYPALLALVATGVVAFLLLRVVPTMEEILRSQGKALPATTEILLSLSAGVQEGWWILLLSAAGALLLLRGALDHPKGRLLWDTYKLRIPVAGTVLQKQAIARFATTLSTLLKSGIPAVEALRITRNIVDNVLLAQTIDVVANKIVEGEDISTPLRRSGIFPPVVSHMIAIGEESGQLEDVLTTVSDAYEEEVELALQKFTSLLEPAMIVVMAGVVGFIVFAIMTPILDMSSIR